MQCPVGDGSYFIMVSSLYSLVLARHKATAQVPSENFEACVEGNDCPQTKLDDEASVCGETYS